MKKVCMIGIGMLGLLLCLAWGVLAAPPVRCGAFLGQIVCWFANDLPAGTVIEGVPSAGQVKVWYKYPGHTSPIRIFVSNGRQVRYFDMNRPSSGMALAMDVAQGESLYIAACDIYYGGNPQSFADCQYRSMGWQERVSNWVCRASPNPYNRSSFDFSDLEAAVEAQGLPILSRQCWGDYQEDPTDVDFNDFVLIVSYERTFTGVHQGASGVVADPANCRAYGWVRYDQNLSRDLLYRVLVDGVETSSGIANRFRADLTSFCSGGTCAFDEGLWSRIVPGIPHTVLVQAQNFMTGEWFSLSGSPQTLTCTSPETPTPTAIPTPTATVTPPPNPLAVSLVPAHSRLVLFAPKVGQPAQTLTGLVNGGTKPYWLWVHTRSPSGRSAVFEFASSGSFQVDGETAGDPYFGVDEEGTWTAWAVVEDASGRTSASSRLTWEVSWWPVHGRP